jgi:hypothetical protein
MPDTGQDFIDIMEGRAPGTAKEEPLALANRKRVSKRGHQGNVEVKTSQRVMWLGGSIKPHWAEEELPKGQRTERGGRIEVISTAKTA